jgi:hypothetical protein
VKRKEQKEKVAAISNQISNHFIITGTTGQRAQYRRQRSYDPKPKPITITQDLAA